METLWMPEVVTVVERARSGTVRHALASMFQPGPQWRDGWRFDGPNRTGCGYIARGRESLYSGRGLEVTCGGCVRAATAALVRQGFQIGSWEFGTRPVAGQKFDSMAAERLYEWSLDSGQDSELGEAESMGWFALFDSECAILQTDSQGCVSATRYADTAELHAEWTALELKWDEFEEMREGV